MNQLFNIFRIDTAKANDIASMPDEPHIHDFEELIVGVIGELEHFIDFKSYTIKAPLISFIAKGKAHRIVTKLQNGNFDMWVLRFKSEFIADDFSVLVGFGPDHTALDIADLAAVQEAVDVIRPGLTVTDATCHDWMEIGRASCRERV